MNIKISIEIIEDELITYVDLPENLNQEQQQIFSHNFAKVIVMMQTGELLPSIFQSIVESGMLTNQKMFSEIIIKKVLDNFNVETDKTPMISPSDAFLFREKQ